MRKIITKSLQIQAQIKILHWQTTSYPEHIAFGNFYTAMDPLIDKFVEAVQGKYNTRITMGGIDSLQISDYSNLKIPVFLFEMEAFYTSDIWTIIDRHSNLVSIVDEIKDEIDKLKYLLTLR